MSPTASFQRVWETLRCSIYDCKNEQLLNFHIITPQIPTCKASNRFQEFHNVKYFKLIKLLKSLLKVKMYLEPKRPSLMVIFCEYTLWLAIFTIKAPSQMFNWVMYKPPKILKFSWKLRWSKIIAIVTTHSVSCFNLIFRFN